jgi:hypothetical protein
MTARAGTILPSRMITPISDIPRYKPMLYSLRSHSSFGCKQTMAAYASLAVCLANLCAGCHAQVRCGDDRDRTDDPLLAKQVLSQLSYAPNSGTAN